MQAFQTFSGIVVPFDRSNIDTDAIIPKQFLKSIERTGFGNNLFDEWRYQDKTVEGKIQRIPKPDFILNQPPYDKAEILLARDNFGCGSSREHAVWALMDFGIKVIIAPSYADIFYSNSYKNGLLAIVLPHDQIDALFQHPNLHLTINLVDQTVHNDSCHYNFVIEQSIKSRLIAGLDDIAMTLKLANNIRSYEQQRKQSEPWLFNDIHG